MRTAANKAIQVGKATMLAIGVGVSLALVLGAATVALAALPGDPLKLGKLNHIKNATTTLSASFEGLPIGTRPVLEVVQENGSGGPALRVENASTGLGGQAIQVKVAPNRSPISVNQDAGKSNLNVDRLDGKDQADFSRADTPTYVSANGAATGSPPFDPFASNRAVCDDGYRLLIGGYFDLFDNGVAVESFGELDGWHATVKRTDASNATISIRATYLDFPRSGSRDGDLACRRLGAVFGKSEPEMNQGFRIKT